MMKRLVAVMVCASLTGGCATAAGPRFQRFPPSPSASAGQAAPASTSARQGDTALLAEYVQKLTLGTRVRVDRIGGGGVTGTLMKATADYVVVQRRTRYPEPPEQIPLDQIAGVTPQGSNGIGKAIAIGAGAGAAAALGVIMILIAAYSD